jgi:hypothetical protein
VWEKYLEFIKCLEYFELGCEVEYRGAVVAMVSD